MRQLNITLLWSLLLVSATLFAAQPVETLGGHSVYGEAMPREGVVVTIAQALSDPDAHVGQAGKFSGEITEVCQKKGCWVVLADGEDYLRVTFKDYDLFVPKDSRGQALVYGTLEAKEIDAPTAEHLLSEGDERVAADGGREFRVVARSVMIKQ